MTAAVKRRAALGRFCASLLVALAIVALALACAHAPVATPLRVMSYNIHAGTGGITAIADVIRDAAPDIVALQEVDVHWSDRSGYADLAAELAERTGMEVRFGHIYDLAPDRPGAPRRQYGLAVLSRHPIRAFDNHIIPRLSSIADEPEPLPRPGFLELTIDVDGRAVRVFDTHLDYRGDPRVRRLQVAAMLDVIGAGAEPTILIGDLNAEPGAAELQPLLARLRDAWDPGAGAGLTFPADTPVKRIDYVLVSRHFDVHATRVPVSVASDHRPVVVDLTLRVGPR